MSPPLRIIYAHPLASVRPIYLPARRERVPPPPAASPPILFTIPPDQLKGSFGGSRSSRLVNAHARRRARRGRWEENGPLSRAAAASEVPALSSSFPQCSLLF